jgi:glycosyltransferase involved in cell wall biosynthesis
MGKTNTLFLTLRVFSATGGIEKVCRIAGKALYEIDEESTDTTVKIFSLYDAPAEVNTNYFPSAIFSGFSKQRYPFLRSAIKQGGSSRMVILSHINLLIVGYFIKLISPKTKLVLIAHGIEVWNELPWWKKTMLLKCDKVLPVSEFTKNKMLQLYRLPEKKFTVLNNSLDPFLSPPLNQPKNVQLLNRYGININDNVLMTLTRMSSTERYKGYDEVMQAVHDMKEKYPTTKYLLVGKYDAIEKQRLDELISRLCLKDQIILTGFIPDEELAAHYALADLYIMPSQKEGFGIVFIEAMFYGKPVIAGNLDGSADALDNGNLGILVNPDDSREITAAIIKVMENKNGFIPNRQQVMDKFSYPVYKEKLRKILNG